MKTATMNPVMSGVLVLLTFAWVIVAEAQSPPKSYEESVTEARKLLTQKKPREAVTQSEAAIRLDDKRWEAYVTAASGYSAQKLYDDAIGMLQLALARAPQEKKSLVRDAIEETRRVQGERRATANSAPVASAAATATAAPTQAEIVLWKTIENSTRLEDFKAYLEKYPSGTFVPLATARVEKLKAEEDAKQLERAKYGLPVAYVRSANVTNVDAFFRTLRNGPETSRNGPDRTDGYLQIAVDGATFRGASDLVNFSKDEIQYVDMSGAEVRFNSSKNTWSFAPKDTTPMQIVALVMEKWGFVPTDNGQRFAPANSGHVPADNRDRSRTTVRREQSRP